MSLQIDLLVEVLKGRFVHWPIFCRVVTWAVGRSDHSTDWEDAPVLDANPPRTRPVSRAPTGPCSLDHEVGHAVAVIAGHSVGMTYDSGGCSKVKLAVIGRPERLEIRQGQEPCGVHHKRLCLEI